MFNDLSTMAEQLEQTKREILRRLLSCVLYLRDILLDPQVSQFDKAETAGQIKAYMKVLGSHPDLSWWTVKALCSGEELDEDNKVLAIKTLNKLAVKVESRLER